MILDHTDKLRHDNEWKRDMIPTLNIIPEYFKIKRERENGIDIIAYAFLMIHIKPNPDFPEIEKRSTQHS